VRVGTLKGKKKTGNAEYGMEENEGNEGRIGI
jgi:hypothetical protein